MDVLLKTFPMTDISHQIEWLKKLVSFDTTSSLSNLNLIEYVEEYLSSFDIPHHRVENEDGTKANLYAVVGPNVEGGVVLSGHTDVVPVKGQDWDTDPFEVAEKNGKLFGRGTCDMKAFSAIGLSLVPEMLKADLKKPIIFALSYDEEVGCLGAPDMIEEICKNVPTPQAVIVGEPSMMKVIDGHKGINSFRTEITGYTTHSSQSNRGVSAVMVAAKLISYIDDLAEELQANAPEGSEFIPPNSTMTVNVIEGGTQLNIMAANCSFEWDLRNVPGDDPKEIVQKVEEFANELEQEMKKKHEDCRIDINWMTNAPCLRPEKDSQAVALVKSITGQNHTEVVSYATEAGQFQQAGLKAVICGPGSIDQAHQANEYISIDQMEAGTIFMRKLIAKMAQ